MKLGQDRHQKYIKIFSNLNKYEYITCPKNEHNEGGPKRKIHGTNCLHKKIDSDLEQKEEIIPKGQNIIKIINH